MRSPPSPVRLSRGGRGGERRNRFPRGKIVYYNDGGALESDRFRSSHREMIDGIVIAGGTSSRFGSLARDKALVEVGGVPMIRRVVGALVPVVDELVVNIRREQIDSFERALSDVARPMEFAIDQDPVGPVGGLETALGTASGDSALVVACDVPLLQSSTLLALHSRLKRMESTDQQRANSLPDCVLPIVDGEPQPLCGAYVLEELTAAIGTLDQTRHSSFDAVLSGLDVTTVPAQQLPGGPQRFLNVNRVTDLRTAQNALEAGSETSVESSFE